MDKNRRIQIVSIIVVVMAILYVSCLAILLNNTEKHFISTTGIVSSQIKSLIKSNEDEKDSLQESLKEEYISRAKALSYILESNPGLEESYDELCKVAELLDIDEINVFGKDDGLIKYSTVSDYVGFSIYSGGQIAFFEPMMNDRSLELCQDVTPNTKEAKLIMYAAVWRSDGEGIVQIGISPERLLAAMKDKNISKLLNKIPLDNTMYIIYDKETNRVVSSTEDMLYGIANEELSIDLRNPTGKIEKADIYGRKYVCVLDDYENYTVGLFETEKHYYSDAFDNALVMLAALVIVFIGVYVIVIKLTERENEKEAKFVGELQNYADTLTNYKRAVLSDAIISLEANLSRDELFYGVWKDDDGKEVELNDILGMTLPCSYDHYIKSWKRKFVRADKTDTFTGSTDREYLINVFNNGSSEITFDYEAKTISGRSVYLRRNICMTKNSSGEIIAYTSVKDITEIVSQTKRDEAYVRALSTEYDSILVTGIGGENRDDTVLVHSRVSENLGAIIDEETQNERSFGKKLAMLVKYVHPEDREQFIENTRREEIIKSFSQDKTHIVNFRISKPDDSYMYYQIRFVPIRDEDYLVTGMIACLRDTDSEIRKEFGIRKEIEDAKIAAETANRAKSTFLFNMSHDIRTPMNAIIGFTDIAQKNIDDKDRVIDSLGKVKMASNHLLTLINDVLDMSRIESGTVKIEEAPVNIRVAKDNLFSMLNGSAVAKNITLRSTLLPSIVHEWIYADRLCMMRVLTNIISNSIKYTNPGGKIDLCGEELPCEKEGYARFRYTVTDTGIGMSEEYLAHIFEPFSRAESATKSGVVGTGLGMAITKSLTELMGGTISIESKLGVGTKVCIEMENRIAEEVSPTSDMPETEDVKLKGKKILLVEDNELNREIATEILEDVGVEIDTAEDGDIAVEKMKNAEEGRYDLILMDIQMPRMDGYEATREIRKLPGKYASTIPIVAMTANAFAEDKQNAIEAGMNGHLAKPIDIQKLLETLKMIIG